jgi:hypothetical protein
LGILGAVLTIGRRVVTWLKDTEADRWLTVPVAPSRLWPVGLGVVVLLVPLLVVVVIDFYVFGPDYSVRHEANAVAATAGAVVGGLYGAGVGAVAAVVPPEPP